MADRNIRFIPKRTAVPGRIPTGTTGSESNFIKQGELALNTADHKLYSYDGVSVFEIGSRFTGGTVSGNFVAPNITASTSFYSGSTELGSLLTSSFARIVHTHPISEITGLQTQLNNKADLSGATFTGNVRAAVFTATTYYSGATLVDSLFARTVHSHVISDVTGLQTQLIGKADLTGATFSGVISAPAIAATNISATTLYSGATLVDSLFARTVHSHVISDITGLQAQLNGKANLTGATFTGVVYAPTLSATTLYSGATLVDSLFARTVHSHVISDVNGLQAQLTGKADLTGATFSGVVSAPTIAATNISATNISATTLYSGSTLLDSLFARTVHSHVISDVSGLQTQLNGKADLTGATFSGGIFAPTIAATNVSATTLYSGATLVDSLFARTVHTHIVSDVIGLQSQLNDKANLTGATFSGLVYVPVMTSALYYSGATLLETAINTIVANSTTQGNFLSLSGGTVSGNTYFSSNLSATTLYSGATLVDSLFARTVHNHVISDVTGLQTQLNGKADLTGATFTGGVFAQTISATTLYSGSTDIGSVFASSDNLSYKVVRATTTASLTANYGNGSSGVGAVLSATTNVALPAQDGIALVAGDRILVRSQSTTSQNGIYIVTSIGSAGVSPWILTRTTDSDSAAKIYNAVIYVKEGTIFQNTIFNNLNTSIAIVLGSTAITYFVSGGYSFGNGLTLSNRTLTALPLANTITRAMLVNGAATSIIGRSANSVGAVADIAALVDGQFLKRDAGVLVFSAITIADITGLQTQLTGKADLTGATFAGGVFAPTVSAATFYSGSTLVDSLFARTIHTHAIADVTGLQTQLNGKADLTGATFSGGVSAPSVSTPVLSATTFYSGSTLVDSLFARTVHSHVISDVTGLQTQLNGKSDLTGATFSGGVFAPAVSATTLYSGSTNLSVIIASFVTGATVQGNYLSIGGGTVTGNTNFSANLSATTYYSGSTLVDSLFARTVHTHAIADVTGLQTQLNGKANLTGSTFTGGVFAPSVSATTLYSGATLVDSLFARTVHTHAIADVTGLQTQLNGKANLTGATFTGGVIAPSISGTSVSGTNIFSGSTNLNSVFAPARVKKTVTIEFALTEGVDNTTKYFYAWRSPGTTGEDAKRSGNSTGMNFANACSPIMVPFSGTIRSATLTVRGTGVQNATATYPVVYQTNLYMVGFANEQDPLVNSGTPYSVNFNIPSTYPVGFFSVGSTQATISNDSLSIPVARGQMLGLKFINGTGPSTVGQTQMAFISLVIEQD